MRRNEYLHRVRVLALSGAVALTASIYVALAAAPAVLAYTCQEAHVTTYTDANSGGTGFTWCVSDTQEPNLSTLPGPCPQFLHADSWNDCISSVEVSIPATQCIALYRDANYGTVLVKYWGAQGPDTKHNLTGSANDATTSLRMYSKTPTTPAGNC